MSLLRWLHRSRVAERRTRVLGEALAPLLPEGAQVLDVGCGDGAVAAQIARLRPDLTLRGIDVHVRDTTAIPVEAFDGRRIAAAEDSYDVIVLVDVLHHARDPVALLREAARVSRRWLVLKDHTCESRFAARRLAWMDRVGNPPGEVEILADYWPRARWAAVISELGLRVDVWQARVPLYPPPVDWLFGRGLHFVARLEVPGEAAGA